MKNYTWRVARKALVARHGILEPMPFPGEWPTRMAMEIVDCSESRPGHLSYKQLWSYLGKPDRIAWERFKHALLRIQPRGMNRNAQIWEFDRGGYLWLQRPGLAGQRWPSGTVTGLRGAYHPWISQGRVFDWLEQGWELRKVTHKQKSRVFYLSDSIVKSTPSVKDWPQQYKRDYLGI